MATQLLIINGNVLIIFFLLVKKKANIYFFFFTHFNREANGINKASHNFFRTVNKHSLSHFNFWLTFWEINLRRKKTKTQKCCSTGAPSTRLFHRKPHILGLSTDDDDLVSHRGLRDAFTFQTRTQRQHAARVPFSPSDYYARSPPSACSSCQCLD